MSQGGEASFIKAQIWSEKGQDILPGAEVEVYEAESHTLIGKGKSDQEGRVEIEVGRRPFTTVSLVIRKEGFKEYREPYLTKQKSDSTSIIDLIREKPIEIPILPIVAIGVFIVGIGLYHLTSGK